MKHQPEDSEWEGFQYEPEAKLQQTMQPFVLPSLRKILHNHQKDKLYSSSQQVNQKPSIIDLLQTKQQKQTLSLAKSYPRIPIFRPKEQVYRSTGGTLIYRGFQPKSFDRYFADQRQEKEYSAIPHKDNLSFNSRFQCGNLHRVYKMEQNRYDLYMRVDTNTQGHLQWFYFEVKNVAPQNAVFTVFKFKKRLALYQRGMRPYIKSKKEGTGWRQAGTNIKYQVVDPQAKSKYYLLVFQYSFRYQNDEVMFAACPPYSYSLLNRRLGELSSGSNCEVSNIGQTLGGLKLPLVTFGSEDNRNFIVVSARTHPGETSGSWVADGLMSYLASKKAEQLLQTVTFKIVPMLNPDGVFVGNYRTGVVGKDFNRIFNENPSSITPEVSQFKWLVKNLQKRGKILLYLDLHGHSIQRNSFIFGPEMDQFPELFKPLISDLASFSTMFKQDSCKLKTRVDCIDIARGFFQNIRKIFSLTIENSLGLYETSNCTYPIPTDRWRLFGKELGQVINKLILSEVHQQSSLYLVWKEKKVEQIKTMTSQLEVLNKMIVEKVQKRVITEKSELKDRDKKFLGKRKFQMMRWKKLSLIKKDSPERAVGLSKKSRKMSEQLKIQQTFVKQQIQVPQSKTTKHQLQKSNKSEKPPSTKSIKKGERRAETTQNQGANKTEASSLMEAKEQQSTNEEYNAQKQQLQEIDLITPSKIESTPTEYKQKQRSTPSPSPLLYGTQYKTPFVQTPVEIQSHLKDLSEQQNESSDMNDYESNSDDLEPEQLQSLFHTVQILNKNRVFQFQEEAEEKRLHRIKEALQRRVIKQPSYHSAPQKMEVYNKFKEIKLNLNNRSAASSIKRVQDEEKQAVRHKYRKNPNQPLELSNSVGVTHPNRQLPTLDGFTSGLKEALPAAKQLSRKPVSFNRAPMANIHRISIIQQTIREQILVQTTKRLQKLQDQSIFTCKPFEDAFLRSRSRFSDVKRKL